MYTYNELKKIIINVDENWFHRLISKETNGVFEEQKIQF